LFDEFKYHHEVFYYRPKSSDVGIGLIAGYKAGYQKNIHAHITNKGHGSFYSNNLAIKVHVLDVGYNGTHVDL